MKLEQLENDQGEPILLVLYTPKRPELIRAILEYIAIKIKFDQGTLTTPITLDQLHLKTPTKYGRTQKK